MPRNTASYSFKTGTARGAELVADLGVEAKFDAHVLEHFGAGETRPSFSSLNGGNTKCQQAADFGVSRSNTTLDTPLLAAPARRRRR